MQAKITQTSNGVQIVVPSEGYHVGRNGSCQVKALELTVSGGKCTLTSINSRGYSTNGEMSEIPFESLMELLEKLQQSSAQSNSQTNHEP